jgi:hypothetical protein
VFGGMLDWLGADSSRDLNNKSSNANQLKDSKKGCETSSSKVVRGYGNMEGQRIRIG